MAQVRWSLTAANDLQDIEDFIARDSILLVESAESLLKNPRIGRVVPEFERGDLREVLFRSYRIVYLLQEDKIFILRVVHGSRDLAALARREPWDLSN